MKFNITLPILAFIVLIIVVYFAFSRENAKILTNKNDEFVFIDSDILLQRMRTNLNELKRILRRDMNKGGHGFAQRIVRPDGCDGGIGRNPSYCGKEVSREWPCNRIIADCPPGTVAITRGSRSCACARLVGAHQWSGGSRGDIEKINI